MSLLICFVLIHYKGMNFNRNLKSRNLDCVRYNKDFVIYRNIKVLFDCSLTGLKKILHYKSISVATQQTNDEKHKYLRILIGVT